MIDTEGIVQKDYIEYKFNIGDADFVFFSTNNMIAESQSAISPIHTHDYCEFFYVLKGEVKIFTESNEYIFSEGDCALIEENFAHTSEICPDSQRIVISFLLKKARKTLSQTILMYLKKAPLKMFLNSKSS